MAGFYSGELFNDPDNPVDPETEISAEIEARQFIAGVDVP